MNFNKSWTNEQEAKLKKWAGEIPIARIAEKLGRSRDSIKNKIERMGLPKHDPDNIPVRKKVLAPPPSPVVDPVKPKPAPAYKHYVEGLWPELADTF